MPNFDWNQARAFWATAQTGSLSAAAQKLGLTQPTLSRQVAALEADLGVLLFERVGRGLQLTRPGQDLYEHVQAMGVAASNISHTATDHSQTLDGLVSVSVSDVYSAYHLPQALLALRKIAPNIQVEVVAVNEISDLRRREADIAIRHIRPEQPELIGKFLGHAQGQIFATPEYINSIGGIKTIDDFRKAIFTSWGDAHLMIGELNALGLSLTSDNILYYCKSGIVGWEMVKQGLCAGAMATSIADNTPNVVPILGDQVCMEFPNWLIAHKELRTSKRIRVVFDFLAEYLTDTIPMRR